jgi:pimeloyl-ACP methyl ester carboxylesterase
LARVPIFAALLLLLSPAGWAVESYDDFPATLHADQKYVIYSHGLIVEGDDPKPVHPELGVYDFPAIKAALFEDGGFNLIAHHRPKNSEVLAYVGTLESWVNRLLAAGVAPANITLVGFSRGAQLTAQAASRLRSSGINTALIAVCSNGDFVRTPPVVLGGRVLSIYETTDVVGSCSQLARRSGLTSFEEVAISTGKKHGAFFLPRREWMTPLKAWIAADVRRCEGNDREDEGFDHHYCE